jgi:hypothetical protein
LLGLLYVQDELISQMFSGPTQLVVVSTAGVLELERRRPADVLQALLLVRGCMVECCFFDSMACTCLQKVPVSRAADLLCC